jgi:hypothetical protein
MKRPWLLALSFLVLPLCGQDVSNFKDVEMYVHKDPNDKPKKADGMLNLDRSGGVLAFTQDNKVLKAVAYDRIERFTYTTKGDRILTVYCKTVAGQGEFIDFKLKGGNRDTIVSTLEAQTNHRAERIEKK